MKIKLPVFLFGASLFAVTYPKTVIRKGAADVEDAKATGDSPDSLVARVAKGLGVEADALEYQPADASELNAEFNIPGGSGTMTTVGYIVHAEAPAADEKTAKAPKGAKGRK